MAQPHIFSRKPVVVAMQPGEYLWCACGLSKTQPFCDGSHATTEFKPVKFTITKAKQVLFCNCKHAAAKPMCDGTHNYLME
ncbi:MAG TPA: CDGSH iron-sulfur domain-containing protein [Planctomycetota bacterium]|nr:CDGSH iron-sulfur domain-containing protein [Planctomycetota bacterium]